VQQFLTLEIKDNGPGLMPIDLNKPNSFGLKGLHERAKSVGGWLDVSSRPGKGTSIVLSVPLDTAQSQTNQEVN
jgi:signal transduction histidine kinase